MHISVTIWRKRVWWNSTSIGLLYTRLFRWTVAALVAAGICLTLTNPAVAECPVSNTNCASPVTVAVPTGGTAGGKACDIVNNQMLNFGTLQSGTNGQVLMRACECPTSENFNIASTNGVLFLGIQTSDPDDFTIIDSGIGGANETYTSVPGNQGCNGEQLSDTSGCPGGNPNQFCYADVAFNAKGFGNLLSNLVFNTLCNGDTLGNPVVPLSCLVRVVNADLNYAATNITLKGVGSGFSIAKPQDRIPIAMSTPQNSSDPGQVLISFAATLPSAFSSGTVMWSNMLQYTTSGRFKAVTLKDDFSTTGSSTDTGNSCTAPACRTRTYQGEGGIWTVVAAPPQGPGLQCVAVPVTGANAPSTLISQVINSLYPTQPAFAPGQPSGTPNLLDLISQSESSHVQFCVKPLMQPQSMCGRSNNKVLPSDFMVTGNWPEENGLGVKGAALGLMMNEPKGQHDREATAWNWIYNIDEGNSTFRSKLAAAQRYSTKMHNSKDFVPQLRSMYRNELEFQAVAFFKGFGGPQHPKSYYEIPQCTSNPNLTKGTCTNGTWQWVPNPVNVCVNGSTSGCILGVDDAVDSIKSAVVNCSQPQLTNCL